MDIQTSINYMKEKIDDAADGDYSYVKVNIDDLRQLVELAEQASPKGDSDTSEDGLDLDKIAIEIIKAQVPKPFVNAVYILPNYNSPTKNIENPEYVRKQAIIGVLKKYLESKE